LTGLPVEDKTALHRIVEQMGGRYARDLDTSQTTHLIAQSPEGAKYQTAASCQRISIVTPAWLSACHKAGNRVNEAEFTLSDGKNGHIDEHPPLFDMLNQVLQEEVWNKLFYPCRFLLLGFEQEDANDVTILEKLIRRGRGTIYHEINETITHIVVKDGSDQALM